MPLENSGTNHPPAAPLRLTERDLGILLAIADYGGVLTTLQLNLLFWPPDLAKRLAYWQLGPSQVQTFLTRYEPAHLDRYLNLLKFLLRVRQLLTDARTQGQYKTLWTWLMTRHTQTPADFDELQGLIAGLPVSQSRQDLGGWLAQTIIQGPTLPALFTQRPRFPGDFISSACVGRLRLLRQAGYLEGEEQALKPSEGKRPLCWYLSKQGRDEVAKYRQIPVREVHWRPLGSYTATLTHRLALNDIRLSLALAARRKGVDLKRWLDDDDLRRIHSRQSEKVSLPVDPQDPDSRQESYSVVLDGFFWLDNGKNWHTWLEVDLSTKTLQASSRTTDDWVRRIRVLSAYYKHGQYHRRYPEAGNSMRLCTVTTSPGRMQRLKALTEQVVGQADQSDRERENGLRRYWFTTFDQLAPTWERYFEETILTTPIWQVAGREGGHTLIW